MALTVAEDLVALRQRCSDIERHLTNIDIALVRIEAALAPKPPAPEPKPPAWATPQGNFGSSYTGPPSVPQTGAAGIAGVTPDAAGNWRDPSGYLREGSGAYVTGRST